jgi:hypothetical protein
MNMDAFGRGFDSLVGLEKRHNEPQTGIGGSEKDRGQHPLPREHLT